MPNQFDNRGLGVLKPMRWQPTTWTAIERAAAKTKKKTPTDWLRETVERALIKGGYLAGTAEARRKRDERARAKMEAEREARELAGKATRRRPAPAAVTPNAEGQS
jgi:hypothetical protein